MTPTVREFLDQLKAMIDCTDKMPAYLDEPMFAGVQKHLRLAKKEAENDGKAHLERVRQCQPGSSTPDVAWQSRPGGQ